MTVGIVTQLGVQGVAAANPNARTTQLGVRVAAAADPKARATQVAVQALVRNVPAPVPTKGTVIQTAATAPGGNVPGDIHYRNVTMLLQGATGYRDLSKYNDFGLADRYNMNFSTSVMKFGTRTFFSTGARNYGIRFYKNPERWNFGARPFTIEGWIYPTDSSNSRGIMGSWMPSGKSWVLYRNSGVLTFLASVDGTNTALTLAGPNVPNNAWAHVCVERDELGVIRMYVNGTKVANATFPDAFYETTQPCMMLGYAYYGTIGNPYNFQGYADDLRVTKGVARYASDIGFPTSASPAPYSDTVVTESITSDPYWDKVTCLINPRVSTTELKRGAALTGMTISGGQITNDGGTVAHVDGQWDIGGRTEPFTLEVDFGWNNSAGNSVSQFIVPGGWIINSGTSVITFYYWNGTGWTSAASWSNLVGDWYYPHGYETTTITRDEAGVFRCYQMGILRATFQSNLFPATPTADLTINGGDSREIGMVRMTWGVCRYKTEPYVQDAMYDIPAPTTGPTYVAPTLTPTYPYDLGFPDPDQTAGSWLFSVGAAATKTSIAGSRLAYSEDPKDRWRWLAGAATYIRNYVRLEIPPEYHAAIDAGEVAVDVSGLGASSPLQADRGGLWIAALNRYGVGIGYAMTNIQTGNSFAPLQGYMPLPAGTRRLAVGCLAYRPAGTTSFVYRDIKASLIAKTSLPGDRIYLSKPQNVNGSLLSAVASDWTDAKGNTVVIPTLSNYSIPVPTTTGKTMDLRCTDDLPASLYTQIDAGEVAFTFKTMITASDTNDSGRIYVEFLDATDTVVGRRKYDSPHPYYATPLQQHEVSVPIPPTARKVVMGIFGAMDYAEAPGGSNYAGTYGQFFEAYCYIPDVGEMPAAAPTPPDPEFDPEWENVWFLLSSRNGSIQNLATRWPLKTFSVVGAVSVASVTSPFGTTAIASNLTAVAASNDYIDVVVDGPDMDLTMTFEGWFCKTGHTTRTWTSFHNQLGYGADSAASPMRPAYLNTTNLQADVQLAYNEWYHVAVCRDSTGRCKLFINGKQQVAATTANVTRWLRAFRLLYSSTGTSEASWVGYVDEIRLTSGVERYTSDFTPQQTRFPVGYNAKTLLSGDQNSGTDHILLSGDASDGDDIIKV